MTAKEFIVLKDLKDECWSQDTEQLAKAMEDYAKQKAWEAWREALIFYNGECTAEELKETGVSITALQPDATDTDIFQKAKAENTVTYKERDLYSPEEVAKAGYEGLMEGSKTVLPGFMNKTQAAMNTVMPDSAIAANMSKQMESSMEEAGRTESTHEASRRERERINASKEAVNGDY